MNTRPYISHDHYIYGYYVNIFTLLGFIRGKNIFKITFSKPIFLRSISLGKHTKRGTDNFRFTEKTVSGCDSYGNRNAGEILFVRNNRVQRRSNDGGCHPSAFVHQYILIKYFIQLRGYLNNSNIFVCFLTRPSKSLSGTVSFTFLLPRCVAAIMTL